MNDDYPENTIDLLECGYQLTVEQLCQILTYKILNEVVEGRGLSGIPVRQGML